MVPVYFSKDSANSLTEDSANQDIRVQNESFIFHGSSYGLSRG
jgi:hypothetical protein